MKSIEQLALRCILPGFIGTVAPDWVRRSAGAGLGGVVLYGRNVNDPEQLAALTAALHLPGTVKDNMHLALYGAAFMVTMLAFPNGIQGGLRLLRRRLQRPRAP